MARRKSDFIWIKRPSDRQMDGILRFMQTFPDKIVRKVIRSAFGKVASKIARSAKARAPVSQRRFAAGMLRRSISSRFVSKPPATEENPSRAPIMKVGAMSRPRAGLDPWYAHFVERGTKYAPARPFLQPAVSEHEERIQPALALAFRKAAADQIKKNVRR